MKLSPGIRLKLNIQSTREKEGKERRGGVGGDPPPRAPWPDPLAPSSTSHFIIASTTRQTGQRTRLVILHPPPRPLVVNPASSGKSNRKTFPAFLFKHYLKRCCTAASTVPFFFHSLEEFGRDRLKHFFPVEVIVLLPPPRHPLRAHFRGNFRSANRMGEKFLWMVISGYARRCLGTLTRTLISVHCDSCQDKFDSDDVA